MDRGVEVPLVDIADVLQRGDDGELGVLDGAGEDAEVVELDIGAHAVAVVGGLVRPFGPDDPGDMRAVNARGRRRIGERQQFLHDVPVDRSRLGGVLLQLGGEADSSGVRSTPFSNLASSAGSIRSLSLLSRPA